MLSKILPVELIVRATCNRPIRWRRVDGIFSRGGGDRGETARVGAVMPASPEAHRRPQHTRYAPPHLQYGGSVVPQVKV